VHRASFVLNPEIMYRNATAMLFSYTPESGLSLCEAASR
jgi:hypothetical protein